MGDWRHKLSKAQRKHLRDSGATTKSAFIRNREFQRKGNPDRCFECREIAQKIGLEK